MTVITKQPWERLTPFAVDFAAALPTGATLSSCTASATALSTGQDATATVLASPTATIAGSEARVELRDGVDGEAYQITFQATLSNGGRLEEDVRLDVRAA